MLVINSATCSPPMNGRIFLIAFFGGTLREKIKSVLTESAVTCLEIVPSYATQEATDSLNDLLYPDIWKREPMFVLCHDDFSGHWRSLEAFHEKIQNQIQKHKKACNHSIIHSVQIYFEPDFNSWF